MSTQVTWTLRDGGEDCGKLLQVDISVDSIIDTDPALLLVVKSTTSNTMTDAELVAVCSPEDMMSFPDELRYPGYFRSPSALFCFPSTVKLQEFTAALLSDLGKAVSAFRGASTASAICTAAATGTYLGTIAYGE